MYQFIPRCLLLALHLVHCQADMSAAADQQMHQAIEFHGSNGRCMRPISVAVRSAGTVTCSSAFHYPSRAQLCFCNQPDAVERCARLTAPLVGCPCVGAVVPSRIAVQHQVGGGAVGRGAARRARDLSGGRHHAREDRPARDALRRHATQPWRQGKALILSQHHGLCIFSCCFAAPKLSRPRLSQPAATDRGPLERLLVRILRHSIVPTVDSEGAGI